VNGPIGIDTASLPLDALVTLIALLGGYLVGSVPLSAMVGHAAGVDVVREGEANPGSANVWKLAGPGWGLLALAGDLAKGVLPVALGSVTVSWSIGWVAGLGALLGASWPLLGRLRGGRGVAVLAGAAVALSPAAGMIGVLLTVVVLAAARLSGRNGRVAAIATGVGTYPLLFLADGRDLLRLGALMTLYLVAVLRYATTRR
jgi:glycerol-3-phosphate acyltransferase PlsY